MTNCKVCAYIPYLFYLVKIKRVQIEEICYSDFFFEKMLKTGLIKMKLIVWTKSYKI